MQRTAGRAIILQQLHNMLPIETVKYCMINSLFLHAQAAYSSWSHTAWIADLSHKCDVRVNQNWL